MSAAGVQLVEDTLYADVALILSTYRDGLTGFEEAEDEVLELLVSLLINYLSNVSNIATGLAERSGRSHVNVFDIFTALYMDDEELTGILTTAVEVDGTMKYLSHLKSRGKTKEGGDTMLDSHLNLSSLSLLSPEETGDLPLKPYFLPEPEQQIATVSYNCLYQASRFLFLTICLDIIREIIGVLAMETREGETEHEKDMEAMEQWGLTDGTGEGVVTIEGLDLIPMLIDIIKGNRGAIQTLIIDEVNGITMGNPSNYASIKESVSSYTDSVETFMHEFCCISPYMAVRVREYAWQVVQKCRLITIGSVYKFLSLNKLQMALSPYPLPFTEGINDPKSYSFTNKSTDQNYHLAVPEPGGSIYGAIAADEGLWGDGAFVGFGGVGLGELTSMGSFRRPGFLGFKTFSVADTLILGPCAVPVSSPSMPPKEVFALRLYTMNSALARMKLVQDWHDGECSQHVRSDIYDD